MALEIMLNGQTRRFEELAEEVSMARLVEALVLKPDRIAVELNGEIARRSAWTGLPVRTADRVEIVHFVGGGAGAQLSLR